MDTGGFKVLYNGCVTLQKRKNELIYSGNSEETIDRDALNFADSALIKDYTTGKRSTPMILQIGDNLMEGISGSDDIINNHTAVTRIDLKVTAHGADRVLNRTVL